MILLTMEGVLPLELFLFYGSENNELAIILVFVLLKFYDLSMFEINSDDDKWLTNQIDIIKIICKAYTIDDSTQTQKEDSSSRIHLR